MELGAFSLSLSVQDIQASRDFYPKLGFEVFGGDISQNWLILKNGDLAIGLFQGMFDKNMLTIVRRWPHDHGWRTQKNAGSRARPSIPILSVCYRFALAFLPRTRCPA